MDKLKSAKDILDLQARLKKEQKQDLITVRVCMTGCRAKGADKIAEGFRKAIEDNGAADKARVLTTGCHGFCAQAPVVVIDPAGVFYGKMDEEKIPAVFDAALKGGYVEDFLFVDPVTGLKVPYEKDIPFYKKQQKIVLRNCGKIDPTSLEDYILNDGYQALAKALATNRWEIVQEVLKSGLRGRGGAGFPTGKKWELAHKAAGDKKFMIVNADEGDPGAFMDRAVLEGDPHTVLEGLMIGSYTIGADEAYVYCRAEYPIAIEHLHKALEDLEAAGLLGENILGSGFNFQIHVKEGAGAFVCGEETALMQSIEGKRGMPTVRPPFPIQRGLWGYPTCINNVETFANVPPIILHGADWYAGFGTATSKGTKIFALAGNVNNTGLVEVPMGITLKEIIYDVGGGIPGGRKFRAALTGGPSGGALPENLLDLPIDYDSLGKAGAIMGSGGLIVMDEATCIVDMAKYFLNFTQSESCGKCVPCRMGIKRMWEILDRITQGQGEEGDVDLLADMAATIKDASLCGLGQTAPNPVLTTIRYFRDEYEAHIREHRCPAKVCKPFIAYVVIEEKCKACGKCKRACPNDAVEGAKKVPHKILRDKCIRCGICIQQCPFDAIVVVTPADAPIPKAEAAPEAVKVE